MSEYGVTDEITALRRVLVHRPGKELKRLTPGNAGALLFDGLPWVERAQAEHDQFTELLSRCGARVHYFDVLLRQTLDSSARAREHVEAELVSDPGLSPSLAGVLRGTLNAMSNAELVEAAIAGITVHELPQRPATLSGALAAGSDFVVAPLPNLLFMRDAAWWVGEQPWVAAPWYSARRREAALMKIVIAEHPELQLTPRQAGPFLEGGDVLLLGDGVLAVGVSERSTAAGVERLAEELARDGAHRALLAVPLPRQRSAMHLDTVLTMVDRDAVVAYAGLANSLQAWQVDLDQDDVTVQAPRPLLQAIPDVLGLAQLRVVGTGLDPVTAEREQWDDGNNTLALEPGVVLAYERNIETNRRLEAAGVTVETFHAAELGSGRGGPRCLTQPLHRSTQV